MNPFDEDEEGESSDLEREITPKIPKAPSVRQFDTDDDFGAAADVHRDTLRAFVACVLYTNVAVLLIFLGPMVWYFEGWTRVGPVLLVVGILAAIRTYQTYREWDRSRDERDEQENLEGASMSVDDNEGPEDDKAGGGDETDEVENTDENGREPSAERGSTPEA